MQIKYWDAHYETIVVLSVSDLELRYLILLQAEINQLDFGSWEMNSTNDLWENNFYLNLLPQLYPIPCPSLGKKATTNFGVVFLYFFLEMNIMLMFYFFC